MRPTPPFQRTESTLSASVRSAVTAPHYAPTSSAEHGDALQNEPRPPCGSLRIVDATEDVPKPRKPSNEDEYNAFYPMDAERDQHAWFVNYTRGRIEGDDPKRPDKPGLWVYGIKTNTRGEATPYDSRIGDALAVTGYTLGRSGTHHGRMVRFTPQVGAEVSIPILMRSTLGDALELRQMLADRGYRMEQNQHSAFIRYLQSVPVGTLPRFEFVEKTGWHGDGASLAYVFADETIGSDEYAYQADGAPNTFQQRGTLEQWRDDVAALCEADALQTFALSVAFAPAILRASGRTEGVGFHLHGESTAGKTTALLAACSVWGEPATVRRKWQASISGIEGAAVGANDALLALDEMGQCDPRDLKDTPYMLMDGTGKSRAQANGKARDLQTWRTCLLSTGERTIGEFVATGGAALAAGQAVRVLDVPTDRLQRGTTGAAQANAVKHAASAFYGTAARAFIRRMVNDASDIAAMLTEFRARHEFASTQKQEARAGEAFALAALVGELATQWNIVPWRAGTATKAAAQAFAAWRAQLGTGGRSIEHQRAIESVCDFIDTFGDARFTRFDATPDEPGQTLRGERAGWIHHAGEETTYLFTAGGFADSLSAAGVSTRAGATALRNAGAITGTGNVCKTRSIAGMKVRVYEVRYSALVAALGGEA